MNLKKIITPDTVTLALRGATKEAVLGELVDLLVTAKALPAREPALRAVFERERKMSTGMQGGVAIPHAKVTGLESLVAAVGIKREGLDFGSLDNQPSRIFILTLSPDSKTAIHIQFLAEISRQLNDPALRAKALTASSKEELIAMLVG